MSLTEHQLKLAVLLEDDGEEVITLCEADDIIERAEIVIVGLLYVAAHLSAGHQTHNPLPGLLQPLDRAAVAGIEKIVNLVLGHKLIDSAMNSGERFTIGTDVGGSAVIDDDAAGILIK